MSDGLPDQAQVVIIGGGVIGCSVAYHLTKLGWRDVVLLERDRLTCCTTWHAAGLLATLRATENMTELAKYTQDLYRGLEAETGQATGFMQVGTIQIATTDVRVEDMRRGCAIGPPFVFYEGPGSETRVSSKVCASTSTPPFCRASPEPGCRVPRRSGRSPATDTSNDRQSRHTSRLNAIAGVPADALARKPLAIGGPNLFTHRRMVSYDTSTPLSLP